MVERQDTDLSIRLSGQLAENISHNASYGAGINLAVDRQLVAARTLCHADRRQLPILLAWIIPFRVVVLRKLAVHTARAGEQSKRPGRYGVKRVCQ